MLLTVHSVPQFTQEHGRSDASAEASIAVSVDDILSRAHDIQRVASNNAAGFVGAASSAATAPD